MNKNDLKKEFEEKFTVIFSDHFHFPVTYEMKAAIDDGFDFFITHLKAQDSLDQLIKEIEGMKRFEKTLDTCEDYERHGWNNALDAVLETISKIKEEA
jgi:hypothetical protein